MSFDIIENSIHSTIVKQIHEKNKQIFISTHFIHIEVLEHIRHTFNQPWTSVNKAVSGTESHEVLDFFSGTLYEEFSGTITEPVVDVIEVEFDVVDDDVDVNLVVTVDAGAFVCCNNDLTAMESSIGSDLIDAAFFWAKIKEQFVVGQLLNWVDN